MVFGRRILVLDFGSVQFRVVYEWFAKRDLKRVDGFFSIDDTGPTSIMWVSCNKKRITIPDCLKEAVWEAVEADYDEYLNTKY